MPNHVQHVVKFEGVLPEEIDIKLPVVDVDHLAKKVAVLFYLGKHQPEWLTCRNYSSIVEDVEKAYGQLSEQEVLKALNAVATERVELFQKRESGRYYNLPPEEMASQLKNPVGTIEVDWYNNLTFFPEPINVIINGYNGFWNELAKEKPERNIPKLECKSGYDWFVREMGTKWGVYDLYRGDVDTISFNTAWSPLSESAAAAFFEHAASVLGSKPYAHYFAEAGCGYWGWTEFSFTDEGKVEWLQISVEDFPLYFVYEGDSDEVRKAKEMGYVPSENELLEYWWVPEGYEIPDELLDLSHYGFGG